MRKENEMKRMLKCRLAVAMVFAVAGCSKDGGHKKVQLWKDGPYWAETNIGAEKPWQFGYYFWWGATSGYSRYKEVWVTSDGSSSNFAFYVKHALTMNVAESSLQKEGLISYNNALTPKHDAAHALWGGNWRMPRLRNCRNCARSATGPERSCVASRDISSKEEEITLPHKSFYLPPATARGLRKWEPSGKAITGHPLRWDSTMHPSFISILATCADDMIKLLQKK